MRNGSTQQHRLSIRGGSQDFGYYASFGYANEEGMVKAADFQRYTYALGFDADINKWIKANAKFSGTTSDRHVNGASLSTAAAARPDIPAYNEDGSLYLHPYISGGKVYYVKNPIIEMTENTTTYSQDNFRLTGNLEFQILPELKLLTQYTYNAGKEKRVLMLPVIPKRVVVIGEIRKVSDAGHILPGKPWSSKAG